MLDTQDTETYTIHNKKFVRVTALLRARGLIDFSNIPEHDREFYLERGTANHKLWQDIEEGTADNFTYDPRVEEYRAGHARFLKETGFRAMPGGIEMLVKITWKDLGLSPAKEGEPAGVAGTLDRLGTIQGRMVLVDYKTSSVPASTAIQTAAYTLMLPSYKFHEIERRGVAFRNNGTYLMSPRYPLSDKDEALYHLYEYRKSFHPEKKP